jgi:hypothetical protein
MLLDKVNTLYAGLIGPDIENYHGSQNRTEFNDCIEYMDRRIREIDDKEIWFLEIGAYKGLWALAFNILCNENNKIPKYVTVTWISQDPNNQDLFKTQEYFRENGLFFKLIDANSTLETSLQRVTAVRESYHVVFIDGDHAFSSVMKDIKNYAPLASNLLIFHDTNTKDCGVHKAIQKSGVKLNVRISYGDIMGIGIQNCKVATPKQPPKKIFGFF